MRRLVGTALAAGLLVTSAIGCTSDDGPSSENADTTNDAEIAAAAIVAQTDLPDWVEFNEITPAALPELPEGVNEEAVVVGREFNQCEGFADAVFGEGFSVAYGTGAPWVKNSAVVRTDALLYESEAAAQARLKWFASPERSTCVAQRLNALAAERFGVGPVYDVTGGPNPTIFGAANDYAAFRYVVNATKPSNDDTPRQDLRFTYDIIVAQKDRSLAYFVFTDQIGFVAESTTLDPTPAKDVRSEVTTLVLNRLPDA